MVRLDDVLGYKNLKIFQDSEFFSFSLDSVMLANFVNIKKTSKKIIDLGCGNGIIPLILSKRCSLKIDGVELQQSVFELAVKSVDYNKLDDQIRILNMNIKDLNNERFIEKYDIVVCNPPYFPFSDSSTVNISKEKQVARHEIEINLREIIYIANRILVNKGTFAMVHRCDRFLEVIDEMRKNNIEPKRIKFVHSKENKDATLFLIEGIKFGKPGLKTESPIIMYDKNGVINGNYDNLLVEVRK